MAQPDKVPDGGKFRARAAAALDGVAGAWGDGDLLGVGFDANGELVVGTATDTVGVVWTREGQRKPDAASYKQLVGGRVYTVFHTAEFVEMEVGAAPPAAGDELFALAAGDAGASAAGAIFLGWIDDTGSRLILRVNGRPVGA
jgi:hypothetical protein